MIVGLLHDPEEEKEEQILSASLLTKENSTVHGRLCWLSRGGEGGRGYVYCPLSIALFHAPGVVGVTREHMPQSMTGWVKVLRRGRGGFESFMHCSPLLLG